MQDMYIRNQGGQRKGQRPKHEYVVEEEEEPEDFIFVCQYQRRTASNI
jgi:hypothetical protein